MCFTVLLDPRSLAWLCMADLQRDKALQEPTNDDCLPGALLQTPRVWCAA